MALPEGPQSRAEQYLAKIAGQAASLPEAPRSRVEQYLDYIATNGIVSKEEIAEQVSDWLEENIHEDPTVVIDSSLSVSGAAADAKATGDEIADLKADLTEINESLGDLLSVIDASPTGDELTPSRDISRSEFYKYGSDIYVRNNDTTTEKWYKEFSGLVAGGTIYVQGTGDSVSYVYAFTKDSLSNGSAALADNKVVTVNTGDLLTLAIPDTATYFAVTSTTGVSVSVYSNFGYESQRLNGIDSTLEEQAAEIEALQESVAGLENTPVPTVEKTKLCVETYSHFFGKKLATSFINDTFLVSGSEGDTTLTITGERSGSTLVSADLYSAVVIAYSEDKILPYVITGFTETTITVMPAIDDDITDAVLAAYIKDSQHLTAYGYKSWMQWICSQNPKYCEKNKYIAKFHPTGASSAASSGFSGITISKNTWTGSNNDSNAISRQYGAYGICLYPYAEYATQGKYGLKWSVNTGSYKGYLETYIGVVNKTITNQYLKDTGYEMYIDVYADNELIYQKVKNTNFVERICVDFSETQGNIRLEVYYKTMRKNSEDSIFVGETTFWVNENYPSDLVPKGCVASVLFDSWGGRENNGSIVEPATPWYSGNSWAQGASGKELERILTAKSGYVCPVYNTSKGSMTSRWGRAWMGTAVKSKNPDIMMTDFGINDYHTTVGGTWEDITDPYGNTIVMNGNPLTLSEYIKNMDDIFDSAIVSGIQPIFIEPSLAASLVWTTSLIDNLATQVTVE